MSNAAVQQLAKNLEIIATRIENLTPAQMHNAMINCDRMVKNFGKSWMEFRGVYLVAPDGHKYTDCTKEQMTAYVQHKREMINQHKYLVTAVQMAAVLHVEL